MTDAAKALEVKLQNRQAVIGIIGLGYVGLPLASGFCEGGYHCVGFDIDPEKIEKLSAGESYIQRITSERVREMAADGRFAVTGDFSRLTAMDVINICVPTPIDAFRTPNLSFVESTAREIARHLRPGQLVVLESTTYPGTTDELVKPILEQCGLVAGRDFFLVFSPEREDPGNISFDLSRTPKVVGGDTDSDRMLGRALYEGIVPSVVETSSTRTAEAVKLTENIFRSVNIALVNELNQVLKALDVDVWEVVDAAKTKPFGFMPFYPGPGVGGHCIPVDPFYLSWKAREVGLHTRFIELAGEINGAIPGHVVSVTRRALSDQRQKALNGARILLIGLAYKKNVDDIRESPSLAVFEKLIQAGAEVSYFDPYRPVIPHTREFDFLAGRRSVDWTDQILASVDAALILTDHDGVDYEALGRLCPLIVDTRNAMARVADPQGVVVKT